jgi:hypothetical protein
MKCGGDGDRDSTVLCRPTATHIDALNPSPQSVVQRLTMPSDEQQVLAGRMLAAQATYRAAIDRYRHDPTASNRLAIEAAQKELDEIQRVATVETVSVGAKRGK